MHAIPRPPGDVDRATVSRVINQTQRALVEASRNIFLKNINTKAVAGENLEPLATPMALEAATGVGTVFKQNVERQTVGFVDMTQDELLRIISSAAESALRSASDGLFTPDNHMFKQLTEPDVNSLVAAAIRNVVVAANAVVSTSRFKPPDDVSCSIAILTWQESSDIFGRRVANAYIAIQVTVRSLNKTNELLVHDIQVAVDTGLDAAAFSRFQAGRDKLLVRAVAERGQSQDRRNLALNSLLAVGAITSSVAPFGSEVFQTSVAVFQRGFIPGFKTLFPDHTVAQLNNINDRAFSASSVNKVIVPIEGSVPLVTFISVKPVEQLPFAWCGYTKSAHTYLGHAQRQECMSGSSAATTAKEDPTTTPDSLDYKKWQPAALRILQDRTFVVIGGVHIKQLTNEPGALSGISCPQDSTGAIDISKLNKDGSVVCKIAGTGLKSITSVKLVKDTTEILGAISAADDGNSADLMFAPDDLKTGSGTFKVMLVDKTSEKDVDSEEHVELPPQADKDAETPATPDAANPPAGDGARNPTRRRRNLPNERVNR